MVPVYSFNPLFFTSARFLRLLKADMAESGGFFFFPMKSKQFKPIHQPARSQTRKASYAIKTACLVWIFFTWNECGWHNVDTHHFHRVDFMLLIAAHHHLLAIFMGVQRDCPPCPSRFGVVIVKLNVEFAFYKKEARGKKQHVTEWWRTVVIDTKMPHYLNI